MDRDGLSRYWGDADRDLSGKLKSRIYYEYDTTHKSKIGAFIHRLIKLLWRYVGQTVTFITSLNCTYVKEVKV